MAIAALLCISTGTVNSHCSNIYRKTACGSVTDLVRRLQLSGPENGKKEEKAYKRDRFQQRSLVPMI